ncbi:MAG: hypothetical protein NC180_02135, partial [Muribaculaceae bacterium]|nr:hypothetical protein [Muribaculaceae bacterium]MCM1492002.1 hypothetical protein [Muribaculaceae bacterium]
AAPAGRFPDRDFRWVHPLYVLTVYISCGYRKHILKEKYRLTVKDFHNFNCISWFVLFLLFQYQAFKLQISCQNLHKKHFSLYKLSPLPFFGKRLTNFFTAYLLFAWPGANHVDTTYFFSA